MESFKEIDIEITDGCTSRLTFKVATLTDESGDPNDPENWTYVDISDYEFTSVIHKLGDPDTVYLTRTIEDTDDYTKEGVLTPVQIATLPAGVRAFGHYTTYETPAGDVVRHSAGSVSRMRGPT